MDKGASDVQKAQAAQKAAEEKAAAAQAAQKAAEQKAESGLKASPMTVTAKKVTAKAKKKTTVKADKAFEVKDAKGKVSFYKLSGNAKVTVKSDGKVVVKKGLKKGKTYKVKVLVVDEGDSQFAPAVKTVTLKVKVAKK